MKPFLKRLWLSIIIFALVVTFLSGAGLAEKKIQLSMWSVFSPADAKGFVVAQTIKEYEAANPNVQITHVYATDETYKPKIQVAMFGGAGPDIIYTWGSEHLARFARQNLLYDLTKELGKDKWGLSNGLFSGHKYRGKIYGIPLNPQIGELWYNKKMFAENGWATPKTWAELMALCEKIKAKQIIPISMGGRDSWTILQAYMYMADRVGGVKLYDAAKTGKASFANPAFEQAFAMLEDLAKKGYLPKDVLSLDFNDAAQLMVQDKAAMEFMGGWVFNNLTNNQKQDLDKWDFLPFPAVAGGKGNPKAVVGAADGFAVNKACKNVAEAVKFLKFFYSKESLIRYFKNTGILVSLAQPYLDDSTPAQTKKQAKLIAEAPSMTWWWDQDLPQPMTQALLTSLQEVVAGAKTPKDAAQAIENARQK